jgi:hypothetical protein
MKVARGKLVDYRNAFDGYLQEKMSTRGHYILETNKRKISSELEVLAKIEKKINESIQKYEVARTKICDEFCERDEDKNPLKEINSNGQSVYVFTKENRETVDNKIEELKSEYKQELEEVANQEKEFKELLLEEIDIDFIKIKIEYLPEESYGRDMTLMFDLIEE